MVKLLLSLSSHSMGRPREFLGWEISHLDTNLGASH